MIGNFRIKVGKKNTPSLLIIDAQSIKNSSSAKTKGYDAGKKVSGIKLHIAVDSLGLPHEIHITKANKMDREGAIEMFEYSIENNDNLEKVLVDGGYTGEKFKNKIEELLKAEVEVAKRSELHTFKVIPKRWIVERTFSWLEKCRRLWRNCEGLISSSLGMTRVAILRILLKRY
jgi:transposase